MKTFLISLFLAAFAPLYAAQNSVTYNATTRDISPTDGKLTTATIKNAGAVTSDTGVFTNGVSAGNGTGAAGKLGLLEGTAPSLVANTFSFYSPVDVAAGGLAFVLPGTAGSGFLTSANVSGVMTLSFTAASDYAPASRTITVAGTANEITSSAGAQDLSANRTWTFSLPTALTFTGKTITGGSFSSPTITTPTIAGAITFPDGVRQTFNPDNTSAGINVGSNGSDPASPSNGDIWYNGALKARIEGATVSLGAGGGGGTSGTVINTGASTVGLVPAYTDLTGTNVAPSSLTVSDTNVLAKGQINAHNVNITNFLYLNGVLGSIGQSVQWRPLTNNVYDMAWRANPVIDELTGATAIGPLYTSSSTAGSPVAGAAAFDINGEAGHYSLATVTTSNLGTNGAACIRSTGNNALIFSTKKAALLTVIKTPAAASSDVDLYELFVGFGEGAAVEPVDGAYFYYTGAAGATNWQAKTSQNSTRTTITTTGSVGFTASTWTWLYVEVTATSGTDGLADFWVSTDGDFFTHIGYSTANIPQSAGREFGIYAGILKLGGSTGVTQRTMSIDKAVLWPTVRF